MILKRHNEEILRAWKVFVLYIHSTNVCFLMWVGKVTVHYLGKCQCPANTY